MRQRGLVVVLAVLGLVLAFGPAWAEDEPAADESAQPAEHAEPAQEPAEGTPAEEHHGSAEAEEHPGAAEAHEPAATEAGEPAAAEPAAEHHEAEPAHDEATTDEGEEPYVKFDADGDGTSDPELEKEYTDALAGYVEEIDPEKVDEVLDARPDDAELMPSITAADFQKIVRVVKKVVLAKMEKKMARSAARKMEKFSIGVFAFSLLGVLLLAMPLVLGKKYPGKQGTMFKYSALAAVTFFLTVNLFGGVLYGMKTAQGALGSATNPGLAIASGTFDTLDENAEDYIVMGRELFVPTLMQLEGNSDEQPAALLIENGKKIVEDAKVFVSVAKMFKKLDFVFQILPIVLFVVSMLLFALAIRPTLTEIIKLPVRAAAGEVGAGSATTKKAMKRVWGELLATSCTVVVLTVLTILSAAILGQIVKPALDALLGYFSLAVTYLQFVEGASSGVVFLTLFGVVLFLALNLATLILSMSFFLGKCQKIFQQRFNDGVAVGAHRKFFKWAIPSVLFVQLFPLLFVLVAEFALDKINDTLMSGIKDADAVPWTKIMLAGPLFLVVAFALLFWAARGFKAIGFLAGYKIRKVDPIRQKLRT
ncbi:MAG: hypothetical protein HOV81_22085 [Kofleriaceae bacterium]|nr:hypothetical protein [Kofleriaceae bacterium]